MNFFFPKECKLSKQHDFSYVRKFGRTIAVGSLYFSYYEDKKMKTLFKVGISASRQYGNSVSRNKFKRLVRELVRTDNSLKLKNINLIISPNLRNKSNTVLSLNGLRNDLEKFKLILM